jgi:hypothetical protein
VTSLKISQDSSDAKDKCLELGNLALPEIMGLVQNLLKGGFI